MLNRAQGKMSSGTKQEHERVMGNMYQSNSHGVSNDNFFLNITSVRVPSGAGKRAKYYQNYEEECRKRRGIVCINNVDNLCLARAILASLASDTPEYAAIRRNVANCQTERAKELCIAAGIKKVPSLGCGIAELQQMQLHLKEYKISVYIYNAKGRDLLY